MLNAEITTAFPCPTLRWKCTSPTGKLYISKKEKKTGFTVRKKKKTKNLLYEIKDYNGFTETCLTVNNKNKTEKKNQDLYEFSNVHTVIACFLTGKKVTHMET